jgi:hypothetical protein
MTLVTWSYEELEESLILGMRDGDLGYSGIWKEVDAVPGVVVGFYNF